MNFYERTKKLRNEYLAQPRTVSTERETEAKLLLLSQLVSKAFFTSFFYSKYNPDELPSHFSIDGDLYFGIDYNKKLLEDVLKDLGYNNFSAKIYPTCDQSQPTKIDVELR